MKLNHSFLSVTLILTAATGSCAAQTIRAYAGIQDPGFSGDGGPAKSAQLNAPGALSIDRAGGLYIVDSNNVRIRRVTADGMIATIAGNGDADPVVAGPATQSPFISVYDIAIDPKANLHIADAEGLQEVDSQGNLSFVVTGGAFPGVAISSQGTIYQGAITRVLKVESDGTLSPVAGADLGDVGDSGDGGLASDAAFYVTALTTDLLGNIYVLDGEHSRIRKFFPGGTISTLAGTGIAGFTGDGGPANQAALNQPQGIAVDIAGNVYVADTENFRIRKITTDGNIATFAGQIDDTEDSGDDGPVLQAHFNYPARLAVSCTSLFVADDQRIRSIDLTTPLIAQNGVLAVTGQKFTVSGCNLASATLTADSNLPLPTILGNAVVMVNGLLASIVSVSPTQIVAQLAPGISAGPATVSISVTGAGSVSSTFNVN
jgi:sugar lactone lactonase YvrE